ncbi:MAG TPA: YceI family protein, partial [Ktedonobacterales bacterium]
GTWIAGDGSVAGFRAKESFLTQSGTIVGRTSAVTGSLVIAENEISSGSFHVDLRTLKVIVQGKRNTTIYQVLDTNQYPEATLTLTQPIAFASAPTNGQTILSHATGALAMHGITHPVTFTILARYSGAALEAAASASVPVSDWGIQSPFGIHNTAVIEFLVVLHRG